MNVFTTVSEDFKVIYDIKIFQKFGSGHLTILNG